MKNKHEFGSGFRMLCLFVAWSALITRCHNKGKQYRTSLGTVLASNFTPFFLSSGQ